LPPIFTPEDWINYQYILPQENIDPAEKAITQDLIRERQIFLVVISIEIGITANFNEYISGNCQR
jgi:hypothetical protein